MFCLGLANWWLESFELAAAAFVLEPMLRVLDTLLPVLFQDYVVMRFFQKLAQSRRLYDLGWMLPSCSSRVSYTFTLLPSNLRDIRVTRAPLRLNMFSGAFPMRGIDSFSAYPLSFGSTRGFCRPCRRLRRAQTLHTRWCNMGPAAELTNLLSSLSFMAAATTDIIQH